ncbi:MAG: hypothetical protein EA424_13390 [Planctomycetaceae bacterium]|nr:MAG: hypothetical protein EA424_13390 [Planctomycetaceae bacterium]
MSHEPDLPAPRDPDTGCVEERSRLAEIERRLKAARPRPPSLDLAVLQQIASGGDGGCVSGSRADGADKSDRIRVERPARAYRWWTALAGSWIGGAAVGVLVTLMLVNRPAAVVDPADSIVRQDVRRDVWVPAPTEESELMEETSVSEDDGGIEHDHAPVTPVLPSERHARHDTLMAMIADPRGGWHSDAWMEGSVLRAGMLYRPAAGELRDSARVARDMDKPKLDKTHPGQPTAKPTIDFEPSAPITRGQLMEQLMSEATRHGVL